MILSSGSISQVRDYVPGGENLINYCDDSWLEKRLTLGLHT